MSTSDVCVNPDRANEMNDTYMMNKILEYMALGKPIVECDLTGGRFSAGQASLYARPDEVADFALELRELHDNSEQQQPWARPERAGVETSLLGITRFRG